MSVLYSALLPHSPLLLKPIGKENTQKLEATLNSYQKVIDKIKQKQINTIVVITPHGKKDKNKYYINNSLKYKVDLKDFGDLATRLEIKPDQPLFQKIQDYQRINKLTKTYQEETLDYGSAIVLYLIISQLNNVKALSISYSEADNQENYEFGKELNQALKKSDQNIAVIASGDMSHCVSKKSPQGYNPKGVKFDNQIKEIISQNNDIDKKILAFDQNLITKAKECGLKSLLLALGILSDYNYNTKVLSYQDDFGIGYLSAEFDNLELKS
ncbi:AmmeMemoRadiSam system protein B [Patescibacteria group bacterium]|nr:AmmeMemoRadiSam system protein B [Patescibacteria group bacterium]